MAVRDLNIREAEMDTFGDDEGNGGIPNNSSFLFFKKSFSSLIFSTPQILW